MSMSKGKLARIINKLIYYGDMNKLKRVVMTNKSLAMKCLPYLANDTYRSIVIQYINNVNKPSKEISVKNE